MPDCTPADVVAAVEAAAREVHEHRAHLDDLDRAIGDGDHGTNLDRGLSAAVAALQATPPATPADALKTVASTLISKVGGAAGPLYGTAFLRASTAIGPADTLSGRAIATALRAGLDGVVARGKATTGEATMLDALAPAADAADAQADGSPAEVLLAAHSAALAGAEATVPMQATKGRASYLGERSIGHADPGATSSALLLGAFSACATARGGVSDT